MPFFVSMEDAEVFENLGFDREKFNGLDSRLACAIAVR
jgi:hypothetical protein